jgi:hypothetical protein
MVSVRRGMVSVMIYMIESDGKHLVRTTTFCRQSDPCFEVDASLLFADRATEVTTPRVIRWPGAVKR